MRGSRYTWLMLICLICLAATVALTGTQAAWSALADGSYAKDPQAVVMRFWDALDARQTDIAAAMFEQKGTGEKNPELTHWIGLVRRDPLVRLKNVEFLKTDQPDSLTVQVDWINEEKEASQFIYEFSLRDTGQGWKITGLKKLNANLSFVGGIKDERLLATRQRLMFSAVRA